MKNFLVIFAAIVVLVPALYSSASMKQAKVSTNNSFFNKFEQTYKFTTETEKKAPKNQQFLELFEKVMKK